MDEYDWFQFKRLDGENEARRTFLGRYLNLASLSDLRSILESLVSTVVVSEVISFHSFVVLEQWRSDFKQILK